VCIRDHQLDAVEAALDRKRSAAPVLREVTAIG
jgi:hypothetical protein